MTTTIHVNHLLWHNEFGINVEEPELPEESITDRVFSLFGKSNIFFFAYFPPSKNLFELSDKLGIKKADIDPQSYWMIGIIRQSSKPLNISYIHEAVLRVQTQFQAPFDTSRKSFGEPNPIERIILEKMINNKILENNTLLVLRLYRVPPLPLEIWEKVIKLIDDDKALSRSALVCKALRDLIDQDTERYRRRVGIKNCIFGRADWIKHFGDVDSEPPLPKNIFQILNNPCVFWPNKSVKQTHALVFIPKQINEEALTLERLSNLVANPRTGPAVGLIKKEWGCHGKAGISDPYWVLMTKDVIPGTREESFEEQITRLNGYRVPKLIEASIAIITRYISTGECCYYSKPILTYTRCQEGVYNLYESRGMVGLHENGLVIEGEVVGDDCYDSSAMYGDDMYYKGLGGVKDFYNSCSRLLLEAPSHEIIKEAFGKDKWANIGDIREEPPLPENIKMILNRPCPYWKNKKVWQTHALVLIPDQINANDLKLNTLNEIVKNSSRARSSGFSSTCHFYGHENRGVGASYWILITKKILPESNYAFKPTMELREGYRAPTLVEAIASSLVVYSNDKHDLFGSNYTICQEKGGPGSMVVGGFVGNNGLHIDDFWATETTTTAGSVGVISFQDNATTSTPTKLTPDQETGALLTQVPITASLPPEIQSIVFGKDKWAKHIGEVEEEPRLPENIIQILSAPCPYWPGKKIMDTHVLTLIPAQVNKKDLTLKRLGELVKKPKIGPANCFGNYFACFAHEEAKVSRSRWVLMTKDVIPRSRNKSSYIQRYRLLKEQYDVPMVIEAATSIFMAYLSNGEVLFGQDPYSATCCWEEGSRRGHQILLGGRDKGNAGLCMPNYDDLIGTRDIGIAGVRRL